MRSRATVQSPAGFAAQNLQRAGLRTRLEDVGYRYDITPAETAAGLVEADLVFGFDPGDVRRYGAVLDGATDDSAALTAAIAQCVETDGAAVFVPEGVLAIASAVTLLSGVTIEGAGRDLATIYATANTYSLLIDNDTPVTDIAIRNLRFEAVSVGASNRAIFFDADTASRTERVKVEHCDFANLFRGLNAHRIAGLVVDDCEGFGLGSSLVYVGLSVAAGRSSRVRVSNIRTEDGDTAPDAAGTGNIFVGYCDICSISRCEFKDTGAYSGVLTTHHHAIYTRACTDLTISDVTSTGQRRGAAVSVFSDLGMSEPRSSRVTIADIRASGATHYAGLRIDQVNGLTINGVQAENCYTQGVYITNVNGFAVSNVRCRNNNQQAISGSDNAAFWVGDCSDGTFSNIIGTDDETTSGNYGQGTLFVVKGTCADLKWANCALAFPGGGAIGYYGIRVDTSATLTRFSVQGFTQNGGANMFNETGTATAGSFSDIEMVNASATDLLTIDQLHKFRCRGVSIAGAAWRYESNGLNITAHLNNFPSSGNWLRDDTVWRNAAAASATPGWRCTADHVASNGGTWKAMANLAA